MSEAPEKQIILTPQVINFRKHQGMVSPKAVAEILGTPLHEGQAEIAKYFEQPLIQTFDHMTLLLSRRWGKTFLSQAIATSFMLTPHSKIMICCFSTSLADVWHSEVLKQLMAIPQLEGKIEWSKKEGIIKIEELNSSLIVCSYLNAQARGVGKSINLLVVDEGMLIDSHYQEELYNMLMPTMSNFGSNNGIKYGKLLVISTPRGTATGSLFARNYLKGVRGEEGYVSFKKDIYTSPFLTLEEIEALRQATPADAFAQEYLVQWTRTNATVARNFNKDKHIIHISKQMIKDMIHHCDIIVAADTGVRDGNAFSTVLYNNKTETYYVVAEHYQQNEITYDFIKIMKDTMLKFCKTYEVPFEQIIFFADPSSLEMRLQSNKLFDLTIHKAKNNRDGGIDYLNQTLQGKGDAQIPQLYISDACEVHISQLEYAEFKAVSGIMSNQFAKDYLRNSHYDVLQCLIYALFSHHKTANNSFIIS